MPPSTVVSGGSAIGVSGSGGSGGVAGAGGAGGTSAATGKASHFPSKIMHPPDDLSLEELRAQKVEQSNKSLEGGSSVGNARGNPNMTDVSGPPPSISSSPSSITNSAQMPSMLAPTATVSSPSTSLGNHAAVSSPMLMHGTQTSVADVYGGVGGAGGLGVNDCVGAVRGGILANAHIPPPPLLNTGLSPASVSAAAISKAQEVSSYLRYNSHSQ